METILNAAHSFSREDGGSVGYYLTSMGSKETVANVDLHAIRIETRIPNDFKPVAEAFVELNKVYRTDQNPVEVFTYTDALMRALNRCSENRPGWIAKALAKVTKELIRVAISADRYIQKNPTMIPKRVIGDFEHEACLTKAARTIHNAFKLCLNDRNEDQSQSRKQYVYFFVGQELKIYYKLQNRDLAKNMEKVLDKMSSNLPKLHTVEKSHAVTYMYYSGIVYCGDRDFVTAYKKFRMAFAMCDNRDQMHLEAILIYLIPLKFIVTKKYPNLQYLHPYPIASTLYSGIIHSLIAGDMKKFDQDFQQMEMFLLRKNLFLAFEELRTFVLLKLIKRVYRVNGNNSHLSIKLITRGIEFSKFHTTSSEVASRNVGNFSTDETECLIANLIYQNYIKGYMSHSQGVLVLSKKDPFPRQVGEEPR